MRPDAGAQHSATAIANGREFDLQYQVRPCTGPIYQILSTIGTYKPRFVYGCAHLRSICMAYRSVLNLYGVESDPLP